jgi:hypothetical protein
MADPTAESTVHTGNASVSAPIPSREQEELAAEVPLLEEEEEVIQKQHHSKERCTTSSLTGHSRPSGHNSNAITPQEALAAKPASSCALRNIEQQKSSQPIEHVGNESQLPPELLPALLPAQEGGRIHVQEGNRNVYADTVEKVVNKYHALTARIRGTRGLFNSSQTQSRLGTIKRERRAVVRAMLGNMLKEIYLQVIRDLLRVVSMFHEKGEELAREWGGDFVKDVQRINEAEKSARQEAEKLLPDDAFDVWAPPAPPLPEGALYDLKQACEEGIGDDDLPSFSDWLKFDESKFISWIARRYFRYMQMLGDHSQLAKESWNALHPAKASKGHRKQHRATARSPSIHIDDQTEEAADQPEEPAPKRLKM